MVKNGIPLAEESKLISEAIHLVESYPKVPLTVDCVIFGFEENKLKVLLIKSDLALFKGKLSLLGDIVKDNEELDEAAYRVLKERKTRIVPSIIEPYELCLCTGKKGKRNIGQVVWH